MENSMNKEGTGGIMCGYVISLRGGLAVFALEQRLSIVGR